MSNEYAVFVPASQFRLGVSPTATASSAGEAIKLGGRCNGVSILAVKQHDPVKHTDYWLPLKHYGGENTYPIKSYAAESLISQRRFNKRRRQEQKQ